MDEEKFITTEELEVGSLDFSFGNPRKISKKKREELKESLDLHGDFGSLVVDDRGRVISGNQRAFILAEEDPKTKVTCRVLHGYTEQEMRQINVASNTHAGEWDEEGLAEWFGDVSLDISSGVAKPTTAAERRVKELAPIGHEKYDYVLIVCRTDIDYATVTRKLGLEDAKVRTSTNGRPLKKARAVWYEGQF